MKKLRECLQKEQEALKTLDKVFDELFDKLWETKLGKVAMLILSLFSLAIYILLAIAYFVIIGYGLKIADKRQVEFYHYSYFSFYNGQPTMTLGEEWCYFREYKGSICENYIAYAEAKKEDIAIKRERKSAEWHRLKQIESKKAQIEAEAQKAKNIEMLRRYENIKRGIQ